MWKMTRISPPPRISHLGPVDREKPAKRGVFGRPTIKANLRFGTLQKCQSGSHMVKPIEVEEPQFDSPIGIPGYGSMVTQPLLGPGFPGGVPVGFVVCVSPLDDFMFWVPTRTFQQVFGRP